jgi:hypothetical protein
MYHRQFKTVAGVWSLEDRRWMNLASWHLEIRIETKKSSPLLIGNLALPRREALGT